MFHPGIPEPCGIPRAQRVVRRRFLLEDAPHPFHIFGGVTPVAARIQIAQIEFGLEPCTNAGGGAGDLAGDKRFAAAGAFMVKENSVRRKQAIGFPVIHGHPVAVNLRGAVRAARMKRSSFI